MISLVVPVYRNEENIPDLLDAVANLATDIAEGFEAVFVVDGSPDCSHTLLRQLLPDQPFASQLVLLSRNFGSFAAIRAGLACASGTRFVVMAADLQEPPSLVVSLCQALTRDQADVALGQRTGRQDPLVSRLLSRTFWAIYRRLVLKDMPEGGVDVFACNERFRDHLLNMNEQRASLVAQIFWLGFKRSMVPYVRRKRQVGRSAWTLRKKLNYLADSVFSVTDLPIRLLTFLGTLGVSLSAVFGLVVVFARLTHAITVPGYSAIMLITMFFGALNCLGLGMVGSYAWRAYENTKQRPLHLVAHHDHYHLASPQSRAINRELSA